MGIDGIWKRLTGKEDGAIGDESPEAAPPGSEAPRVLFERTPEGGLRLAERSADHIDPGSLAMAFHDGDGKGLGLVTARVDVVENGRRVTLGETEVLVEMGAWFGHGGSEPAWNGRILAADAEAEGAADRGTVFDMAMALADERGLEPDETVARRMLELDKPKTPFISAVFDFDEADYSVHGLSAAQDRPAWLDSEGKGLLLVEALAVRSDEDNETLSGDRLTVTVSAEEVGKRDVLVAHPEEGPLYAIILAEKLGLEPNAQARELRASLTAEDPLLETSIVVRANAARARERLVPSASDDHIREGLVAVAKVICAAAPHMDKHQGEGAAMAAGAEKVVAAAAEGRFEADKLRSVGRWMGNVLGRMAEMAPAYGHGVGGLLSHGHLQKSLAETVNILERRASIERGPEL